MGTFCRAGKGASVYVGSDNRGRAVTVTSSNRSVVPTTYFAKVHLIARSECGLSSIATHNLRPGVAMRCL
eukprot:5506141-Pyramimonas_sp.AAC.4